MQNRNQTLIRHIQQFIAHEDVKYLNAITTIMQRNQFRVNKQLDLLGEIFFNNVSNLKKNKISLAEAERVIFSLFSAVLPHLSKKEIVFLFSPYKLGYPIIQYLNSARILEIYYKTLFPHQLELPQLKTCLLHGKVKTINSQPTRDKLFDVYVSWLHKAFELKMISQKQHDRICAQVNKLKLKMSSSAPIKSVEVKIAEVKKMRETKADLLTQQVPDEKLVERRSRAFQYHFYTNSAFSMFHELKYDDKQLIWEQAQKNGFGVK